MCAMRLQFNSLGFELYDDDRCAAFYRASEIIPRTEVPKPCFAPIFTPSGKSVTEYRPADHLWHTGLYFGWVHVNRANLWGGPWYLPETGKYEYVENTHGIQRHDAFPVARSTGNEAVVAETLTWLDASDTPMIAETRRYVFTRMTEPDAYLWQIDTRLAPVVEEVTLGASKAARYSGLVLRMGPPFSDARHLDSEGREGHENVMGQQARWVSASGASGGMAVIMDHSENPRQPVRWFARRNLLGPALLMDGEMTLRQPDNLRLRYGIAFFDDPLPVDNINALYRLYTERAE
ncbi:MAG: PmoA family protein [candidate division Zixibacteria bacterium]|nr:PmoA family protein [candidate division Zixibacteria bacterium]